MVNRLDKVMYSIHATCFDCVIKHETKLKVEGKFEEYQKDINKQGLTYHLKEMETILLELLMSNSSESFVTEAGTVEKWQGGNKKVVEQNIEDSIKFLETLKR
jgi:hypothetical protein